ncbi:hypothetical protein HOLleu_03207 [Holothuria leucospilota]|uniref:Uncharacterized protein n=1 Tax=Holothuria leucospilota TaxID=206669 RepID=A0A9Q1HK51_HOLLE|nr:hypothetical protein HOLleu_03207 [Holothuria leucospilota]
MANEQNGNRTKRRRVLAEVQEYIQRISSEIPAPNNESRFDQELIGTEASGNTITSTEVQSNRDLTAAPVCETNFYVDKDSDFHDPLDSDDSGYDQANDTLQQQLSSWANHYNISHNALSRLLDVLRQQHPHLPKDPRTFLGTVTK